MLVSPISKTDVNVSESPESKACTESCVADVLRETVLESLGCAVT